MLFFLKDFFLLKKLNQSFQYLLPKLKTKSKLSNAIMITL